MCQRVHRAVRAVAAAIVGLWAMGADAGSETTRVQFIVVTPDAEAAQPPHIYFASSLDGWQAQGRPLRRIAPGIYEGVWMLPRGVRMDYKFLRAPDWTTVEKDGAGNELPNRALVVSDSLSRQVVVHRVERWADRAPASGTRVDLSIPGEAPPVLRENTLTGDIRFHHRFYSPQLRNERTIVVWLPPGYEDELQTRYPVFYLQDGNNLFDARTSFSGVEWGLDESAQRLIADGRIAKLLIVGIYNNPDRTHEYTPTRDARLGGGGGDLYLQFVMDTLKPFVDVTYRTRPEPEHTAIGGSSLGGLIALYAALRYPHVFGRAAALSLSAWWDQEAIVELARGVELPSRPKLWIDIGLRERRPGEASDEAVVGPCRRLVEALRQRGYRDGQDLRYVEVPDGRHHESAWAARVPDVLAYLFPESADPPAASPSKR